MYSGGEHGETPELQSLLKPLLEKHNVDMYLCGHGLPRLSPKWSKWSNTMPVRTPAHPPDACYWPEAC